MKRVRKTKIISFVGYSGTGKTTFLEKLIVVLKKKDLKIALIKHDAHKFELDYEGKDTYKFYHAGADIVNIFSSEKCGMVAKREALLGDVSEDDAKSVDKIVEALPDDLDIIILEGCRASNIPKIGVSRKATKKGLSMEPKNLVALITDEKTEKYLEQNKKLKVFGLDDIEEVADYIANGEFIFNGIDMRNHEKNKNKDYAYAASIDEAMKIIEDLKIKPKTEKVKLGECNGRVIAKDYKANANFPPFRRAPLDGYAFKASDTVGCSRENPLTLKITEEIPAGKTPEFAIKSGYAAKILTGAPVPKGADVVERYEATEFTDETVTLFNEYKTNQNVVPEGEDFKKGYTAITKGTKIDCFNMGVLGIIGVSEVEVYKKPKVAFISTGSELVDVECKTPQSKIRNSSVYVLGGMAENQGAESIYSGIVVDDAMKIANKIREASTYADLICTTGGASVGDYDLIMKALDIIGAKVLLWKVRMKPGMAFIIAKYRNSIFFGFSGNPGSAAMTMTLFGSYLIRRLTGLENAKPKMIKLRLSHEHTKKSGGTRYVVGVIEVEEDGKAYFVSNEVKGNGVLSALQGGQVVGIIPPCKDVLKRGTEITAYLL